jgi:hypothetical protein
MPEFPVNRGELVIEIGLSAEVAHCAEGVDKSRRGGSVEIGNTVTKPKHADLQSRATVHTPWRWRRVGKEDIGAWLLQARTLLEAGQSVDLRGTPADIQWIHTTPANADPLHPQCCHGALFFTVNRLKILSAPERGAMAIDPEEFRARMWLKYPFPSTGGTLLRQLISS